MRHKKIDGQLLNMDKTWRHLSMKQRSWIYDQLREEYVGFLNANNQHPNKERCRNIVDVVYGKIQEREIWIPYGEVRKAFSSKLSRYKEIKINGVV